MKETLTKNLLLEELPICYGHLVIRLWTRQDLDTLAAWSDYPFPYQGFKFSFSLMNASEKDELFKVLQGNPDRIILVVDHRNILAIGYPALTGTDWMECCIGNLGFRIHPEWCDQGLGTSMLCTVYYWVFNRGIRKVRLDVADSNARAIRCYDKVGFRNVGEMWQNAPGLKGIDTSHSWYDFLRFPLRQENEVPRLRFLVMEIKHNEYRYSTRFRMYRLNLLLAFIILGVFMFGCDLETTHPDITPSTVPTELPAELMPGSTQTLDGIPAERHLTLPSGLRIDEYTLQHLPEVEPLTFVPYRGSQQEILSQHEEERAFSHPINSFFADGHFSMSADFGDQNLSARGVITNTDNLSAQITVEVVLDDTIIISIPAGDVSPLPSLQGLWTHEGHWYLEIASVMQTYDDIRGEFTIQALGHIIKDGEDLNQRFGYQEMFAFQLLKGKPFCFINQNGEIGFEYDNQQTLLGYETIPHYSCCSAAELNPKPAKNMVSFFAQKDGYWYYVEIGIFE